MLLEHKRGRKEKAMVNKMKSVIVGTKKLPIKLKIKHTIKATKTTTIK